MKQTAAQARHADRGRGERLNMSEQMLPGIARKILGLNKFGCASGSSKALFPE
jgi:hypothetical protein